MSYQNTSSNTADYQASSIYHFGPTNFGAVSWAQLLEDTRKIFEAARDNSPDKIFGASGKQSTELRGPSGEDDEPTIDERSIAFNGYGDHSGEPFILYKKGRADWCKTRDEEYYWVVALVLIRAHKHGDIKVGYVTLPCLVLLFFGRRC